jgi:hypothetical protein
MSPASRAKVYDKSGSSIGTPVNWPAIGQPTFHGGPVQESDLAPLGAFQVVVVGPPGGHAHFTSGMGTITVTCTPDISAQLSWPNPTDAGTGETSNCYYGKVQEGYFHRIVQPFGLPSPKFTTASSGTGLLPNSKLTATAIFSDLVGATQVPGIVDLGLGSSQSDGSFSVGVSAQDPSYEYSPGTQTTTVTDADGNWATGVIPTDVNWPQVTSFSGLRQ